MTDQYDYAEIEWRDGVFPVSRRFDDPYFSLENGPAETRHVFLAGSRLPDRFTDGFQVAELGFGTGLNLLCLWDAWLKHGMTSQLNFTSFEAYPMTCAQMERVHSAWPNLCNVSRQFLHHWNPATHSIDTDTLKVRVIIGDARLTVPNWIGSADAWFLDGFSPAKNPELWSEPLLEQVARHTSPGGSFATYTAAGHVRQGLAKAGFEVTRAKGFGRKRHMSTGTLTSDEEIG